jgi:hypothetical protein
MAGAKQQQQGAQVIDLPQAEGDDVGRLLADIAEEHADAEIAVYRANQGGNSKMEYLRRYPVGMYTYLELLDVLRDTFGGGFYRLHIKENGGLLKNMGIAIAGVPKSDAIIAQQLLPQQLAGNSGNADLVNLMGQMQEKNREDLKMLLAELKKPGFDYKFFLPLVMPLLPGLFSGVASLMRGNQQDPLKMLATVMEMQSRLQELMPGGESQEGIAGIISTVKPMLGELMQAYMSGKAMQPQQQTLPLMPSQPVAQPVQRAVPVPVAQASPPAQPPTVTPLDILRKSIAAMIRWASKKLDPQVYAVVFNDGIPDELFDTVVTMLDAPDWFAQLAAFEPAVIPHQAWITELRNEFIALTADEEPGISAVTNQENPPNVPAVPTPAANRDTPAAAG